MNESESASEPDATAGTAAADGNQRIGRRGLVGGLALGGVAVGAGAVGSLASRSGGSGIRRERLSVEVACLGPTIRTSAPNDKANEADNRVSLLVEGWVYPEGTINGDGFIPVEEGSIGRWFCKGWFIIDADRAVPHLTTHQDYIFGSITPERPFPPDMLASVGLEGTDDKTQVMQRAVIGGTGKYFAALGVQRSTLFATNASLFPDSTDTAPCWRVEFDLRLLD
jgi:hypothetical protein